MSEPAVVQEPDEPPPGTDNFSEEGLPEESQEPSDVPLSVVDDLGAALDVSQGRLWGRGSGGATAVVAADVLAVARQELGTRERPAGSNKVKYTAWYGMVGAWCAMFVSWVAAQAGATHVIPRHAWTPSGAQWFKDRGRWGSSPRVGAIVYFAWPSMGRICHVGIVEAVHADGSITAIEGNTDRAGGRTGGQVMRQRRRSHIAGYGYPDYDTSSVPDDRTDDTVDEQSTDLGLDGGTDGGTEDDVRDGAVLRRGSRGKAVADLQRRLCGMGVDVGKADGDFGPRTESGVRGTQVVGGCTVDGEAGPQTMTALARLRRPLLAVDGQRGRCTVALWQHVVSAKVDGDWGPATVRASQKYLRVTVDGDFGKQSTRALQKLVGATADGVWGPATTRSLQRWLNQR